MSNKTNAERLDDSFQTIFQGHLEVLNREMHSNAALIARLKEQQAARKSVSKTTVLPENDSTMNQAIKKL